MRWVLLLALVVFCVADQCTTVTEAYGGLAEHASPEFIEAMENILGRKLNPDEVLMKIIVSDKASPKKTVYGQLEADKSTWEFDGPDMKSATRVIFFKPFEELTKCRPGELYSKVEVKPFIFETVFTKERKI